jgi:peptidoglycan-associated lipoprotein
VSQRNAVVEVAGYAGLRTRGNPDGYELTNGLRWGVGAAFPQRYNVGLKVTAELYGEHYFNNILTAPAGLTGSDGSVVPTRSIVKSPAVLALGLTWQSPKGFFIGAAGTWNVHMSSREDASQPCVGGTSCPGFPNEPKDDKGFQVRIGFHPGTRSNVTDEDRARGGRAPTPPPTPPTPPPTPPTPPPTPPTPPARANQPPTVQALCDPCTVEVGKTSTVTANAQDPDGDPLTYRWSAPSGTFANGTNRQTVWTAPQTPGPVVATVAVSDGKGGTANANVTITVTRPRTYEFEDVHFDFDRATLLPDAMRILDQVAAALQQDPNLRVEIEGHTDDIGTADYNLALGDRRATSARDYLIAKGVAADRIRTVSYGEEKPAYDNGKEDTRRLNRRAVMLVRLRQINELD